MEEMCRKTLFAPVMKNSAGCRRQFRVKMWGTSLRDDKLTGGLGNAIAATEIRGRRLDSVMAGKLSPSLQHIRRCSGQSRCVAVMRAFGPSRVKTHAV